MSPVESAVGMGAAQLHEAFVFDCIKIVANSFGGI
jgi:hypothetical protein